MKRIRIFLWMTVCIFFLGSAVTVSAAGKSFSQEDSYLARSFSEINKAGELKFRGSGSPSITDYSKGNGILIAGNASQISKGRFLIDRQFSFTGNRVARIAVNALAGKNQNLKLAFYLDDQTTSFATFSLEKQGREEFWSREITLQQNILEQNIRGQHSISFEVISEGSNTSLSLFLRSIEFVESGIPTVYMDLDESLNYITDMMHSSDKSIECYGKMTIEIPAGYTYEYGSGAGTTTSEDSVKTFDLSYLRGRGNSTWAEDKKPYRIKLDKKSNLFGMGSSKNWALIANKFDNTKVRNRLTYWLGSELGMEFTPKCVPVDVVMNGVYFGSYYLSQIIRVDKSVVNIDDLEEDEDTKASTDPDVISGGYLLGFNLWGTDEGATTFETEQGMDLALESPSFDGYSNEAQLNYIKNYVQQTENAIYGKDFKDENGVSYTEYLDLDSAVDYYWIQEISMNGDGFNTSSTYLYKKRNGKLYWGPLWDFDYVAWTGSCSVEQTGYFIKKTAIWFNQLLKDPVFTQRLVERWPAIRDKLLYFCQAGGKQDQYIDEMEISLRYDVELWGLFSSTDEYINQTVGIQEVKEEEELLREWILARVKWIDENVDSLKKENLLLTLMVDDQVYATKKVASNTAIDDLPDGPSKPGYTFFAWKVCDEEGQETDEYAGFGSIFSKDTTLKAEYISKANAAVAQKILLSESRINLAYSPRTGGSEAKLYASVTPSSYGNTELRFISSNRAVAEVGEDGTIYAVSLGDAFITVSNGSAKADCLVHVYSMEDEYFDTGLSIPSTMNMKLNEEKQIVVSHKSIEYDYEFYCWHSTDTSIATIDNAGVVRAKKAGSVQMVLIYGPADDVMTCTVTITDPSKSAVKKGSTTTYKGVKYKVTYKATKGGNVTVTGTTKKTIKSVSLPSTIKIKGETFKVTSISGKAFYKCKKLKTITLGNNLKSIGKNAFKSIHKNAKFKVPSAKKKAYKKLLTSKTGFRKKTMKIK